MNPQFDFSLIVIFSLAQWRITMHLLRYSARRWAGLQLAAARAAIACFNLAVLFGYSFSFAAVLPRFPLTTRRAMVIGAATMAYLAVATAVLLALWGLRAVRRHLNLPLNPARRRALSTAGNLLIAAPFTALGYGTFIERTDFRVRQTEIPFPDLPPGLDGLQILHLSDIHLSAFLSEAELARVIDACRQLHPHLTVITGDLISARGDPLDACIRQLARLQLGCRPVRLHGQPRARGRGRELCRGGCRARRHPLPARAKPAAALRLQRVKSGRRGLPVHLPAIGAI